MQQSYLYAYYIHTALDLTKWNRGHAIKADALEFVHSCIHTVTVGKIERNQRTPVETYVQYIYMTVNKKILNYKKASRAIFSSTA